MVALRSFRPSGPSFSDLVPYAALVENGVILLKDGSLMAGWYFAGPDSESSTDFERNEVSRRINAILARLGSGWMIQVEAVRVPTTAYPARERSFLPDPVSRSIDEERRVHFERESGHFESRHALVLTWKPLAPPQSWFRPPRRRRCGIARTRLRRYRPRLFAVKVVKKLREPAAVTRAGPHALLTRAAKWWSLGAPTPGAVATSRAAEA